MNPRITFVLFSFLIVNIPVEQGTTQDLSRQFFPSGERIIRIAEPGQVTDSVNVWGDVNSAGRYLVPEGTRLAELISYSFGPSALRGNDADIDWTKIRLQIKISRYDRDRKRVDIAMFKYNIEDPEPAEMFEYNLQNNDIVTLQVRRKPGFVDYLRIIGPAIAAVATTILVVDRL